MENLFLFASRNKLRFETNKGLLTAEDLWDLSLTSLDNIARGVNKVLKDSKEESFIAKKSNASSILETSLEILKFVISAKQDEAENKLTAQKRVSEIATLKNLLAEKEQDGLKSLTAEEIKQRLDALQTEL